MKPCSYRWTQQIAATGILFLTVNSSLQPGRASQTPTEAPALGDRYPRYTLQREDVVSIVFPLSPEFNQTVTIQPDGYITLQGTVSVYAKGLTSPALSSEVKNAYKGILHNPIVSIDVQDFQKPLYTVSGQVSKPGQYELRADITVAEAIAVAGGMTMATAKTRVFLFHRTASDWLEVRQVDLHSILRGKHVAEDALVRPGDMIYVPESFITKFRKYVPYSINGGTYLQQAAY